MSDTIYTARQQYWLLVLSLVVLAGLILLGLLDYITAFLGAGILYVVFRPWFTALVHRRGWNRTLVTVSLLLFAVVVLVIPFFALSSLLLDRIRHYAQNTAPLMELIARAERLTGYSLTDGQNVRQMGQQVAVWLSGRLPSLATGLLHLIVIIGLMLFSLYFMFKQEELFLEGVRRYLPFDADTRQELGESLKNNVNANVLGQALVALVQGILTGLTLWVFQVPDALFWGTVAFFLAFIPVLGTPLVWGPAGLIKLSQGETGHGVGILLVGIIVIVNIDNLLRMLLAKRMGNIHPVVTLVGVVLGVELFGIVGLVMGPLLLSYFLVLMRVFARKNRRLS